LQNLEIRSLGTFVRKSRKAGFTLIEVMGALLILSVGMVSAVRLATECTKRLTYVDRKASAVRIAGQKADSLKGLTYASLQPRVWTETVSRGADQWQVSYTVSQWSTRVRKLEVSATLVGDTVASGPLSAYRADSW
jgi:prepilin-type N-terminal cleavage/methylation domain-containing protein